MKWRTFSGKIWQVRVNDKKKRFGIFTSLQREKVTLPRGMTRMREREREVKDIVAEVGEYICGYREKG